MNCNDYESVIKITENSTIKESIKECVVQSSTCPITEGYKAAIAQYTIWFNGIRIFNAKQNLCDQQKGPMELAKALHTVFGLQTRCPVEKVSINFNDETDLSNCVNLFIVDNFLCETNCIQCHSYQEVH